MKPFESNNTYDPAKPAPIYEKRDGIADCGSTRRDARDLFVIIWSPNCTLLRSFQKNLENFSGAACALGKKHHKNAVAHRVVYLHLPTLEYHWRRTTALRGIMPRSDKGSKLNRGVKSSCGPERFPLVKMFPKAGRLLAWEIE